VTLFGSTSRDALGYSNLTLRLLWNSKGKKPTILYGSLDPLMRRVPCQKCGLKEDKLEKEEKLNLLPPSPNFEENI